MKDTVFIAILAIFAVASSGYTDDASKRLPSMAIPSVTHGNTRVTLLHIARTTSWSNQYVDGHEDQRGPTYAIPGVYLEFLIEQIGEESARSGLNTSSIKLLQNGTLISSSDPVIGGGDSGVEQYGMRKQRFGFKYPEVNDRSMAGIMWNYLRGVSIEPGKITIRFEAGFDQEYHAFEFKDIPLN